jgi:glycosyltransferase involved in cell wall biosynthesis
MKIAFFYSSRNIIPPPKTGGIEQPGYYWMGELARRGHKITLYATPESKIPGVRVKKISPSLALLRRKYPLLPEGIVGFYDLNALADFFLSGEDKKFDLIQFNNYLFYEILPFAKLTKTPIIIQINYPHGMIYPYLKKNLKKIRNVHYLPMSNFVKKVMPGLPYLPPLYPVFDFADFPSNKENGQYLLSIGRLCPEKGVDLAIKVAKKSGQKLVIAGGIKQAYQKEYFDNKIKPWIDGKKIMYLGEVDFKMKIKLYQRALATLFPIQWDEPFGIVLLESMACGTPVIAFDRAAVREIVKNGKNGFIVPDGNVNKMAARIKDIPKIDRLEVRRWTEKKFSLGRWMDKYEKICRSVIEKKH